MNRFKIASPVLWVLIAFLVVQNCENYQPKTYHMSDFDNEACTILSDSLFSQLMPVPADTFNSAWADSSISEVAAVLLDSLNAKNIQLNAPFDSLVSLQYPATADTSYFALTASEDRWVFYFTDHIAFNLFTPEGNLLEPASTQVDAATALECDTMKTRIEYELVNTEYLVQFIETDKIENSSARFWIVPKL